MSDYKTVEFRHIRLEPADNGFVLEYTEVKEKPNSMEDRDWCDRQVVFLDGDSNNGIDQAMAKMKEMYMFNKIRKGDANATPPSLEGSVIKTSKEY